MFLSDWQVLECDLSLRAGHTCVPFLLGNCPLQVPADLPDKFGAASSLPASQSKNRWHQGWACDPKKANLWVASARAWYTLGQNHGHWERWGAVPRMP